MIAIGVRFLATTLAISNSLHASGSFHHAASGHNALANGLWEVASHHFQQALQSDGLTEKDRADISIRCAEACLRSGAADDALDILSQSSLGSHPESSYWKAQALAQKGHFLDALNLLDQRIADPTYPYHAESVITASSLRILLGQTDAALDLLGSIAIDPANPVTIRAHLRRTSILILQGRTKEARAVFPDIESLPATQLAELMIPARLIEGRLLIAENSPKEAASLFQAILAGKQTGSSHQWEMAALGLVDSLIAREKQPEALAFLLEFIQSHPESSNLDALFERLIPLLPPPSINDDQVWQQIDDWSGSAPISTSGFIATWQTDATGALPMQTTPPVFPERIVHALFAQCIGWMQSSLPQAPQKSRFYINRMLAEAPTHPLTTKILIEIARRDLSEKQYLRSFELLDVVRQRETQSDLQGEAAFLKAMALWKSGDQQSAAETFLQAARALSKPPSRAALFNASLIQLIQHEEHPDTIPAPPKVDDPALSADLQLEQALATSDLKSRLERLEAFLGNHADHPRAAEARLATANAALATYPPDLSLAAAQIDTIKSLPGESQPPADQIALTEIRILDRKGQSEAVIDAATRSISEKPDAPGSSEIMFLLGRNLYQIGKYNDARLALERLASVDEDTRQAQACWLLSARAATMVATLQSKQEALILFDKAIQMDGPLSIVSRLEKARLLIDLNRPQDAESVLDEWFQSLDPHDPSFLPAGFLLAESIRSQGSPEALEKSMVIYDQLLERAQDQPDSLHRLQYLRGLTFEQMGDPKSGAGKRIREAFVAYYSALETETPPAEWYYFELCGFKALSMLIDAGRWPAAIACARRIASFKGPRAAEAEEIASQLQLKHQIWED